MQEEQEEQIENSGSLGDLQCTATFIEETGFSHLTNEKKKKKKKKKKNKQTNKTKQNKIQATNQTTNNNQKTHMQYEQEEAFDPTA